MLDLMIKDKFLSVETSYCTEVLRSNPDRVRQVFNINVIKYFNEGGMIRISVTEEIKWLCVSGLNTGDGIAKEELGKIFDRFYRAGGARTQDGSYGLGLFYCAICNESVGRIPYSYKRCETKCYSYTSVS